MREEVFEEREEYRHRCCARSVRMVHYRDDFHFGLRLYDVRHREIGFPDFDWELRIHSEGGGRDFIAGSSNGELLNCRAVCGRIEIDCVGHGLRPGLLSMEFRAEFRNENSGRLEKLHHPEMDPGIFLTVGRSEPPRHVDVEILIPLLKGDKGEPLRYEDLTEEDKVDLICHLEILDLTDEEIAEAAGLAEE